MPCNELVLKGQTARAGPTTVLEKQDKFQQNPSVGMLSARCERVKKADFAYYSKI